MSKLNLLVGLLMVQFALVGCSETGTSPSDPTSSSTQSSSEGLISSGNSSSLAFSSSGTSSATSSSEDIGFSSSSATSSNSLASIPWNETITYGTLLDARDQKSYRTTTIGSQIWMAENLDFDTADGVSSWKYESSDYSTFGRLYTQELAMKVCPSGWHLPDTTEWRVLLNYVDSVQGNDWNTVTALKATQGWNKQTPDYTLSGDGTDLFGFRSLPGGYYFREILEDYGEVAYYWTPESRIARDLTTHESVNGSYGIANPLLGYSVRCVKN